MNNLKRAVLLVARMGLATLLLIGLLMVWGGIQYRESAAWREHSDRLISEIRELRVQLESKETSSHSYLITGQPSYKQSWKD